MHFFKSKKCRNILSFFMAALITIFSILLISTILERKESKIRYLPFIKSKQKFDVLFMGTSHGVNAFFPMELWNDYGIASYNLSMNNALIPTQYWILKNAFRIQKPKILVIDTYFLWQESKTDPHTDIVHTAFDAWPLSKTKFDAVTNLVDNDTLVQKNYDKNRKWWMLFKLGIYHSRWSELKYEDFCYKLNIEKGAISNIGRAVDMDSSNYALLTDSRTLENKNTTAIIYLKKIVELCNKNDIQVLFTYLPFSPIEIEKMDSNTSYYIAGDCGIPLINFMDMNIINFHTDLHDRGHLNPSGARKVTDYIGRYIKNHYELPDHRLDKNYENWFSEYEDYINFKVESLKSANSLDTYLMLLADKNFNSVIEIENKDFLENTVYKELLKNSKSIINENNIRGGLKITVFYKDSIINERYW